MKSYFHGWSIREPFEQNQFALLHDVHRLVPRLSPLKHHKTERARYLFSRDQFSSSEPANKATCSVHLFSKSAVLLTWKVQPCHGKSENATSNCPFIAATSHKCGKQSTVGRSSFVTVLIFATTVDREIFVVTNISSASSKSKI